MRGNTPLPNQDVAAGEKRSAQGIERSIQGCLVKHEAAIWRETTARYLASCAGDLDWAEDGAAVFGAAGMEALGVSVEAVVAALSLCL